MTDAARAKRYRDRLRGGPPRAPKPCGTYAAYRRHLRKGEEPCGACRTAYNEYQQDRRKSADAQGPDDG